jgi:hypothetical protein
MFDYHESINIMIDKKNCSYNIISDIAGNYETFLALKEKMPKGVFISVGDMIDRGPKSKEVLEWFANNGLAVRGNHEGMLIDAVSSGDYAELSQWTQNGGISTIKSISPEAKTSKDILESKNMKLAYDYINSLPYWITIEIEDDFDPKLIVTHAPIGRKGLIADNHYFLWNREHPKPMVGCFQVYGHNWEKEVRWHTSEEESLDESGYLSYKYGACIDTSASKKITGFHWPSMELFEQKIID